MSEMNEFDENAPAIVKRFMYVNRRAPYGTIYALECLEVVLVAAAFDQDVSVVFMDDGVCQLKKKPGHDRHRDEEFFEDLRGA